MDGNADDVGVPPSKMRTAAKACGARTVIVAQMARRFREETTSGNMPYLTVL